jgi:Protein of unknown function (DUF2786)
MTTGKDRRTAIIAKVQALFAKTVENGCTEAEAMAAASAASRLMKEHDLTYKDIEAELRDERYGARARPMDSTNPRRRTRHEVSLVIPQIAAYFHCKFWSQNNTVIIYFGMADDTELAHQLTDLIRVTMDAEWSAYLNSSQRDPCINGRTLRASFMIGMAHRLRERLDAMKAERDSANVPATGRALVVVKNAIVTEMFATYAKDAGLNLRSKTRRRRYQENHAHHAGRAAGDRVDLGGGKIDGGPARIGGR